jgi:hypothetical protein
MATVFWFKVYNPTNGGMRKSPRKATEDAIHCIGGQKVWGSAEEVPDSLLDCNGFYAPPTPVQKLSDRNQALVHRTLPYGLEAPPIADAALTGFRVLRVEVGALNALLDAARREGWEQAMDRSEDALTHTA